MAGGPALGAVYTGVPCLLMGFLFQNPISFAYTSPNRKPQNTIEFEPALLLHLWRGWYVRSADATQVVDWRHHSPTMLPLSLVVGRVMVRPGLPPVNVYVAGQWTGISPVFANCASDYGQLWDNNCLPAIQKMVKHSWFQRIVGTWQCSFRCWKLGERQIVN